MEPAQHPSGADQSTVPSQRTSPESEATVPVQQPVPPTAAAGAAPAVDPVHSPVPPTHPAKTGQPPIVPVQRTGPEPLVGTPATSVPRRWLRPTLAVIAGMLALFCLGGVGIAYVLYDGVTALDRSAPDVVVDNYLRAYLVERNDVRADLYVCDESADLDEIRAFRRDLEDRERAFSIQIRVSWGSLTVETTQDGRRVTTDIRRTIGDGSEQAHDRWQFEVVDQDGWRVCGASRLA